MTKPMAELPDLLALSPKMANRAWMKWLADVYPLNGKFIPAASDVGMAIAEWGLERGKSNEDGARKNLSARIETLKAAM